VLLLREEPSVEAVLPPVAVRYTAAVSGPRGAPDAGGLGMAWNVHIYTVDIAGVEHDVVSPIDGRWLFEYGYGLADTAIFGALLRRIGDGGRVVAENFQPSRTFLGFLHDLLAAEAPNSKFARKHARKQGDGYLYLIDGRTPDPQGEVPPEDIIGALAIRDGALVPGSYHRNDRHALLSSNGFFVLPAELETTMRDAMEAACAHLGPSMPPRTEASVPPA
jgi:hypothetical protein